MLTSQGVAFGAIDTNRARSVKIAGQGWRSICTFLSDLLQGRGAEQFSMQQTTSAAMLDTHSILKSAQDRM